MNALSAGFTILVLDPGDEIQIYVVLWELWLAGQNPKVTILQELQRQNPKVMIFRYNSACTLSHVF